MRISWRILNAVNKGFQRTLQPLNTPAGNISWYKKWYEIHPLLRRPADRIPPT